jgi:hypothetical protein
LQSTGLFGGPFRQSGVPVPIFATCKRKCSTKLIHKNVCVIAGIVPSASESIRRLYFKFYKIIIDITRFCGIEEGNTQKLNIFKNVSSGN